MALGDCSACQYSVTFWPERGDEMGWLVYVRLIGFTFGTLLQLFWMVVILGYRRQRNFERVFFFLCLALFFFYGGSLLALNAQIHYSAPPPLLTAFAKILLCAGLCLLPPLLIHLHFEYAETRGMLRRRAFKRSVLLASYVPVMYFGLRAYPVLASSPGFDFLVPGNALGRGYGLWLTLSMLISATWEMRFRRRAPDRPQFHFHNLLAGVFFVSAAITLRLHVLGSHLPINLSDVASTGLALVGILPSAVLIYLVGRFNFLQIGRQKNLVYAVSATFLALLYLSFVRRLGVWLEPVLPPEATASILLFILVFFFEPLQRLLGRRLRETAHQEMDRVQELVSEIRQEARQGNVAVLERFTERRVQQMFELAAVKVSFWNERPIEDHHKAFAKEAGLGPPTRGKPTVNFSEGKVSEASVIGGNPIGFLRAEPHGAALSGETRAALEWLCQQLPGAIELCRALQEKLQLERELAERERLALVGQMAASISHNLKNPLGSMKTILQVQLENPELPESMRAETKMVLDEINRLSGKLSQLLQFSRPAGRGAAGQAVCDPQAVMDEVSAVLRREAESKGIAISTVAPGPRRSVAISPEGFSDIFTNLLVNALHAAPSQGHVEAKLAGNGASCELTVEDDGDGVPENLRDKILQPFFTTKSQGTGLGLAIVSRRVIEAGGKLAFESPVKNGRGTRFVVRLPFGESQ
jgi:signal transduction histidine kinase